MCIAVPRQSCILFPTLYVLAVSPLLLHSDSLSACVSFSLPPCHTLVFSLLLLLYNSSSSLSYLCHLICLLDVFCVYVCVITLSLFLFLFLNCFAMSGFACCFCLDVYLDLHLHLHIDHCLRLCLFTVCVILPVCRTFCPPQNNGPGFTDTRGPQCAIRALMPSLAV